MSFFGRGDSVIFCRAIFYRAGLGSKMSLNIFSCSKCWTRVLMGVCDVSLFSMKIHAKCFQITHRTMALPILKII